MVSAGIPGGCGAEPPHWPRATGATGPAAALALSLLPRLSQLDSLCAAAQALRALRSPGADLLPVLATAVQVQGRGWESPRRAGPGGHQLARPHPERTPFCPGRAQRPRPRPPGTWRPGRAEPATSARPSWCSPTRGQWRWQPCCGPCWRGCGAEAQPALGHPAPQGSSGDGGRGSTSHVPPINLCGSPNLAQSTHFHEGDGTVGIGAGGDEASSSRTRPHVKRGWSRGPAGPVLQCEHDYWGGRKLLGWPRAFPTRSREGKPQGSHGPRHGAWRRLWERHKELGAKALRGGRGPQTARLGSASTGISSPGTHLSRPSSRGPPRMGMQEHCRSQWFILCPQGPQEAARLVPPTAPAGRRERHRQPDEGQGTVRGSPPSQAASPTQEVVLGQGQGCSSGGF